jgi:hypothetical protein
MWNNNMGLNHYSKHMWMGKWMILLCDFSVPWFWTNPTVVLIQSTLCTIKPQREVDDNTLFPTQYLLHIASHRLGNRFAAFPHGPLAPIRNWLLLAPMTQAKLQVLFNSMVLSNVQPHYLKNFPIRPGINLQDENQTVIPTHLDLRFRKIRRLS